MRTGIRDEIAGLWRQYAELVSRIGGMPIGPVRMELKRRRNEIAGKIVTFRQMLIGEELKKENPQHVPRVSFGTEVLRHPRNRAEGF